MKIYKQRVHALKFEIIGKIVKKNKLFKMKLNATFKEKMK